MAKPDYNDGVSVECEIGQHPAFEVAMCEACGGMMCDEHEGETGLCTWCEREALLEEA